MNRSMLSWVAPVMLLAAAALGPLPAAAAGPTTLPDSTRVDQWSLSNGLRVTTREVPGASSVAITVAYGSGSAADPVGREGLAWLLAEARFMAAAGDVPERSRGEMQSLRPGGWRVKVLPRATLFIELATPQQFPGVLHQTATRMRGVRLTPVLIEQATAAVRGDLGGFYARDPDSVSWALPRELAAGADSAALARLASGGALEAVTMREVERVMRERFVPANATLAIAGEFSGIDLHAFLEREFGSIPAGTPPPPTKVALRPAAATLTLPGLTAPLAVVGVIAPAVTDIDHAEFYLAALLMASRARSLWGDPQPPGTSRFKFSLFDDPDLVRFYPPIDPEQGDTTWVGARLEEVLDPMSRTVIPPDVVDGIKRGVYWLLGGAMPSELARRAPGDPAVITNLSSTMAMRALWQPESFWAEYRTRFGNVETVPLETWVRYALDRQHQVRLVLEAAAAR